MEKYRYENYNDFMRLNRIRINNYLNIILWASCITGPMIALGIRLGMFHEVNYVTSIGMTIGMPLLAVLHRVLIKRKPDSPYVGILALIVIQLVLTGSSNNHLGINICWFLAPILALMFCNRKIYIFTVCTNFCMMLLATWLTAPYYAGLRTDYESALQYFVNHSGAYVIELIILFVAGYHLENMLERYFRDLISQYETVRENEKKMHAQMDILESMAQIYDNVNLIDFDEMTELSLCDETLQKHSLDFSKHSHTRMNHRLKRLVNPDFMEDFQVFTNITNLQKRLKNKKAISKEFISVETGWFRAQYISVKAEENGVPHIVIFTTQNIDADKRKEEYLIQVSTTDELTKLYNRRLFEEDTKALEKDGLREDFVVFSIDINGLKTANDTLGHAAGDELITAAADCLNKAVADYGKAYRTGGDEFMLLAHMDHPEALRETILDRAKEWSGQIVKTLSMSIGYAAVKEFPEKSLEELKQLADARMYEVKNSYYESTKHNPRRRL
ncbi:MAG: GGDEF domain-containing protein [Acetatifactor sp.]|nr:GGDEF domain-containing protein [Acetatifactor sp.]